MLLFVALVAAGCSSPSPEPFEEIGVVESTTTTSEPEPIVALGDGDLRVLAHRGLYQTFDPAGVDDETCTADRIYPVGHEFIENTVASMEAAFALGAEVVEIDIAPSSDGVLVVFHDWTVDCRTEETGEVRALTWDELSELDVGYGYTSDGQTFPLRGKGVGLMPTLEEVFARFGDGQFLIHFKSGDVAEAELLHEVVQGTDAADQVWAVYGAPETVEAYVSLAGARGFTEPGIRDCLTQYVASGPDVAELCSNTVVAVPIDLAGFIPGWPQEFTEAMDDLGTHVMVTASGGSGIDSSEAVAALPSNLDAYVWTDRIDVVGPEVLDE